jgi:hypothetical protein
MVTVDEDKYRHLGITWIESSINEYLSMWVGNGSALKADVSPGGGYFSGLFSRPKAVEKR